MSRKLGKTKKRVMRGWKTSDLPKSQGKRLGIVLVSLHTLHVCDNHAVWLITLLFNGRAFDWLQCGITVNVILYSMESPSNQLPHFYSGKQNAWNIQNNDVTSAMSCLLQNDKLNGTELRTLALKPELGLFLEWNIELRSKRFGNNSQYILIPEWGSDHMANKKLHGLKKWYRNEFPHVS